MKTRVVFLLAIGLLFGRESFGVTQLITNGGFEAASPAPWQVAAGGFQVNVPVVTSTNAFDGNNYLNLGNFTGVNSEGIFQTVTIPTNALLAEFTYFWGCSIGNDLAGVDVFQSIVEANNNPIALNQQSSANIGYNQASFNVTAYAGKTVNLGFIVQAQQPGVGAQTFFAVDDVSLLVYTLDDIPPNDYFTNATTLVTSSTVTVFGTNILATSEPGEPKIAGANPTHSLWWKWTAPSNGVVLINTTGSSFNTVLGIFTGPTVSNLTSVAANDDQNANGGIFTSQVKFPVSAGTQYLIAVDGKTSAIGVIQLNLSFVPDTKPPTLKISSPKSGSKLTNSTVTVKGTATDNVAVGFVQYRLENADGTNDYQMADGTNTWTATISNLIPGPNTIRVQAFDTSSNASPTAAVTVTYVVVSPISVTVSPAGSGTVSPSLNGQLLAVGNSFTVTAKPAAGQIFSSWTGSIIAGTPVLTFVMQSNMVLVANFVPNPFTSVAVPYQGLFLDTNGPAHQSSGLLNLNLTTAGSFSAKLTLAGKSMPFSGQFSADGSFSNNIPRKGLTPISLQMNLDFAHGIITGLVSDGVFTSELAAAGFAGPGALVGSYTMVIPGGADGVALPGGDGFGSVKISSTGSISFSGVLADGTKITQKANVLVGGNWAFYVPLYSGKGSLFGFLQPGNGGGITGNLTWAKTAAAGGTFYPGGFTFTSEIAGSAYHFTNGVSVLTPPPAELWLANGNLASSFTNQVAMNSSSQVTSTNATLKMTVTTSTGLFKGTVIDPGSGKTVTFNGVVLQNQNYGDGFFVGTNQTGRVFLGP